MERLTAIFRVKKSTYPLSLRAYYGKYSLTYERACNRYFKNIHPIGVYDVDKNTLIKLPCTGERPSPRTSCVIVEIPNNKLFVYGGRYFSNILFYTILKCN